MSPGSSHVIRIVSTHAPWSSSFKALSPFGERRRVRAKGTSSPFPPRRDSSRSAKRCPWQIQPGGGCAMTAEENKAVVRRYYEDYWNKSDVTFIDACIGPDVLAHLDADEHVSHDGWRNVITVWRRAFPDIHHVVDRLVAEGDFVAANI